MIQTPFTKRIQEELEKSTDKGLLRGLLPIPLQEIIRKYCEIEVKDVQDLVILAIISSLSADDLKKKEEERLKHYQELQQEVEKARKINREDKVYQILEDIRRSGRPITISFTLEEKDE